MVDLNKKYVSKETLLTYIEDIDIYRFYTGEEVKLQGNINSPLRDDANPSFGYFIRDDEVCFNDFALGGGDCIKFVQLKYGLNYFEALSKIAIDFDIDDKFIVKKINKTQKDYDPNKYDSKSKLLSKANNFTLQKQSRKWSLYDLAYWRQYGIEYETLQKYNVKPVNYIFINTAPIACEKFAYCFTEYKDNTETYKIYQPYSENYKWLNGHDESVWQGWSQLPETGDEIIITKSLKDVMAIHDVLGIPSISLQAESIIPKHHIIDELKKRFKKV